jgi:hypothetical protein
VPAWVTVADPNTASAAAIGNIRIELSIEGTLMNVRPAEENSSWIQNPSPISDGWRGTGLDGAQMRLRPFDRTAEKITHLQNADS